MALIFYYVVGRVGRSDTIACRHLLCPYFFRDVMLSSACKLARNAHAVERAAAAKDTCLHAECSWPLGLFIRDDG